MEPLRICVTDTVHVGIDRILSPLEWLFLTSEEFEMVNIKTENWFPTMARAPSFTISGWKITEMAA